ncbi:non-hydrolyzing UDP-N-acetylglucosamine 2-epimerase [Zunongwangia endophytica]|uniref:Non-hydrolyzing UDP-N-acetylglucosamine 2-epimerase n=1 Tax=Zunongwangia endophytica TaxID=1808945 RepID=A0ABV8H453_9FLAO|nr:UDP-N-acetylglucosamine 2-epimerase (non-hydrolyzing) [Zunongwangia endophytica]MDN3595899.1 UDP-N-acetylglucosamine 2-epimerase (non-hydrolyzing) [Zunongwangia endophytica]
MKITIIAGARPNFMKIAPLIKSIKKRQQEGFPITFRLVHTGQHYDKNLSDTFFEELNIPFPDTNLDVKSGSQAEQTGKIMIAFEKELLENPCDLVIVVGDVNSTMACSIVAKKEGCKVAHIEAGIRSGDLAMPEEINRIVTDSLTDYYFTTSHYANQNLKRSGIDNEKIFFVGNIMIDTLRAHEANLKQPPIWEKAKLKNDNYFVITMHRPRNVNSKEKLTIIISKIASLIYPLPLIFPVHPRTFKMLDKELSEIENLYLIDPLGYLSFNFLVKYAKGIITDSGGITEEATVLNVPCITLRENTERPETCEIGTNVLVGTDLEKITKEIDNIQNNKRKKGQIPILWDGKTADRITASLIEIFKL